MAVRRKQSQSARTTRTQTRDIPLLTREASVQTATLDEKERTVEVVWTTGARVLRGFFDRFFEELSLDPKHVRMGRLENGAPLLDSHNGYSLDGVLGVVESAALESKRGVATVRLARDERADQILSKIKDGILRHVSVGYQVHRFEQVEGGDEEIPVYRAVDWEPYEISMVPMGADAGAGVRSEGADSNPCEFVTRERQETKMAKPKKTSKSPAPVTVRAEEAEDQKEPQDGDEDQVDEAPEDGSDDDAGGGDDEATKGGDKDARAAELRAEGARIERARLDGINRTVRVLGIHDSAFVKKHVDAGTPLAKFRSLAMQRAEKEQIENHPAPDGGPAVEGVRGGDERDKYRRQAVDALLQRCGIADRVTAAAKKRGETVKVDGGQMRGMNLLRLAADCLERVGIRTRGLSDIRVAELALDTRAGGYQTTSDFPVILDETVQSTLLADYELAEDTWRRLVKIGSVSNFKPSRRVRLGSMGRLDRVPEHAEFKNKPVPDGTAEQVQIETFGNIFAITRQVVIDDDLGAILRLVGDIGRTAGLTIELEFWDLLALNGGLGPAMSDGLTLFHASHGNIQPTGTTLGVAGLDANRLLMAEQTDPSGNNYIVMRPHTLLVPTSLGMAARSYNVAEFDIDAADGVTPNGVRGMFEQIIDTPRITGTRRYVFADPQRNPTFEVNFLNGQQAPFIESRDGWRIDGKEYKVRHDFGIDPVDWRTAITDDGTP